MPYVFWFLNWHWFKLTISHRISKPLICLLCYLLMTMCYPSFSSNVPKCCSIWYSSYYFGNWSLLKDSVNANVKNLIDTTVSMMQISAEFTINFQFSKSRFWFCSGLRRKNLNRTSVSKVVICWNELRKKNLDLKGVTSWRNGIL